MPKVCSNDFTYLQFFFREDTIWCHAVDILGNFLYLYGILIFELGFKIVELNFLPQYKLRQ